MCANLIEYIKKVLYSEEFVERHKISENQFIRKTKLTFQILFSILINFNKGSYQDELDHFFKALFTLNVSKRFVTKSAYCVARMKIKYDSLIELREHLVEYFYANFNPKTWCGFNLIAIDSSTLKVPKEPAIIEHFGTMKPENGEECPLARISQMYDVLNKISVDAIISPYNIGERELLKQHLLNLLPNDLLLLDRGYPAYWIFNLIVSLGGSFCSRISYKQWKIIEDFYESGEKDSIIQLPVTLQSKKECDEMGLDITPLELRLIRVELDTGNVEILITSLTDKDKFEADIFGDLYNNRWPIEEDYKTMKCRLEVENFTGKSVLSVYQDFHAKIFAKNFTSILAFPTDSVIKENSKDKKFDDQLNFAQALSKTKDVIALLFNSAKNITKELISQLHDIFIETTEPIRKWRKYPRKHKIRRREFYGTYKSLR